jgi:hypothetical protein
MAGKMKQVRLAVDREEPSKCRQQRAQLNASLLRETTEEGERKIPSRYIDLDPFPHFPSGVF